MTNCLKKTAFRCFLLVLTAFFVSGCSMGFVQRAPLGKDFSAATLSRIDKMLDKEGQPLKDKNGKGVRKIFLLPFLFAHDTAIARLEEKDAAGSLYKASRLTTLLPLGFIKRSQDSSYQKDGSLTDGVSRYKLFWGFLLNYERKLRGKDRIFNLPLFLYIYNREAELRKHLVLWCFIYVSPGKLSEEREKSLRFTEFLTSHNIPDSELMFYAEGADPASYLWRVPLALAIGLPRDLVDLAGNSVAGLLEAPDRPFANTMLLFPENGNMVDWGEFVVLFLVQQGVGLGTSTVYLGGRSIEVGTGVLTRSFTNDAMIAKKGVKPLPNCRKILGLGARRYGFWILVGPAEKPY